MDLGKVQMPKVLRTLSNTTEPGKRDWASESSSKRPSVVCMDFCRKYPSQSLNYSDDAH